jgi:antitoxin FitA
MAQLLVRKVDDDLVRRLKLPAAAAGRSVEAEHRVILEEALRTRSGSFAERAAALRDRTDGRKTGDAAALIRADRDRDLPEASDG